MKNFIRRFMMINLGVIIMGGGLFLFLIPSNLAVGGVTGLAMVIQNYIPSINLGLLMGVFNIILFLLAFTIIGSEFGGYTIYCSFLLSGVIGLLDYIVPNYHGVVDDFFLNLIFGIIIQGIGMAIVFYENASTGGTDIIAKIINKFSRLEIGRALFLSDALITLVAGFAFGPTLGLYAFLGIMINGLIIDKVIAGFETKIHALIISDNNEVLANYIHNVLRRGTTYLNGMGGYSMDDKKILSVVLSRKEYMQLKRFVTETDPNAFISVTFIYEVLGEGFDLILKRSTV